MEDISIPELGHGYLPVAVPSNPQTEGHNDSASAKAKRTSRSRFANARPAIFEHHMPCLGSAEAGAMQAPFQGACTLASLATASGQQRGKRPRVQWVVVQQPTAPTRPRNEDGARVRAQRATACGDSVLSKSSATITKPAVAYSSMAPHASPLRHRSSSDSEASDTPRALKSSDCMFDADYMYSSSSSFENVDTDLTCTFRSRMRRGSTEKYDFTEARGSSSSEPDVSMPSSEDSLSEDLCPIRSAQSIRPQCVHPLDLQHVPGYGDQRLFWSARSLATVRS